jgi:hypothetical protein
MSIYYLYIKTHKTTGLKYLGQTSKSDPYAYSGSGKDWLAHLRKQGVDIYTDILMVCNSKKELNHYGRYYSNFYRVTTAVDDYGNKIWANCIPETGGGSGEHNKGRKRTEQQKAYIKQKTPLRYGENHPGYDNIEYEWRHEKTGEIIKSTRQDFIKNFNVSPGNVCAHINGTKRIVNGWQIINGKNYRPRLKRDQTGNKSSRYDHTVYCWKNSKTSETVYSTRYDLITKYKLHSGRISHVVSGKQTEHNGWSLIR